ncbi:MAG: alpha/beta hydrolase, partial [Sphingomonadaceae bacterium]|nr:alpha/beta hydrolase [Sphingomonadaceae bacterium]
MSEPAEHYFDSHGTRLCYFEWGDPSGQPILLLHATGFHARCWDQVIAHLPHDHRIIAVDQLGHGRSSKPDTLSDWGETAEPVAALVEALDLSRIIGAGHSGGGHYLVQLAAQMGERFERLVLIDPVIMKPSMYDTPSPFHAYSIDEHPIARRRDRWASPDEMFERFKDRSPYDLWQPEVLRDYCEYGLLPAEDGDGFVLACPARLEASVYI